MTLGASESEVLAAQFWGELGSPDTALGALRWKLDDHQLRIYDPVREWEVRRLAELQAGATHGIHRVFVVDCGRQVGKTFSTALLRIEDAHRFPNETQLIASATEKQLKDLIIPVINTIIADAPEEVRPRFFSSRWGMRAGFHCPASDSIIKLVGVDMDPDGLRGPGLGGANFTEAGFIDKLRYAVSSIVLPQFSRRPFATCLLESSAPEDVMHDFDTIFVPDAQRRKAYVFMTLFDNTALPQEVKQELYETAKSIDPDDADREYLGLRRRNAMRMIVPEFEPPTSETPHTAHVKPLVVPAHACAMAAFDPGTSDLFAMVWAYWDAARQKLCVVADWSGRNTSTGHVAEEVRRIERALYGECADINRVRRIVGTPREELSRIIRVMSGEEPPDRGDDLGLTPPPGLCYWHQGAYRPNPVLRVSDTDSRLIADLNEDYAIPCVPTEKDDKDAALYALRNAFRDHKIEIDPSCTSLIQHLKAGRWNAKRTDWERHTEGAKAVLFGHYDLIAALVYCWRMSRAIANLNPTPPTFADRYNPGAMHIPSDWLPVEESSSGLEGLFD